jgi:hypothetical protein
VVTVDGIPRAIRGILPEGFGFPFNQGAWTILAGGAGNSEPVELVGRLAPGASVESATAELSALWSRGDPLRTTEDSNGRVRVEGFTGGRRERGEGIAFLGLVLGSGLVAGFLPALRVFGLDARLGRPLTQGDGPGSPASLFRGDGDGADGW